MAESRSAVAYQTNRRCRVAAGEWLTPYTGTIVTDPRKLDVDHMVPLGNVHQSGAWIWSAEQRERYANYLDDPPHLIAVTASANRSKGARGPHQWKPDDQGYWCQCAIDWISIKSKWGLTVTQDELSGLNQMLYTCNELPKLWVSHGSIPGQHRPTGPPSDDYYNDSHLRLMRRSASSRGAPRSRKHRRRTRFPEVDRTQREGR